MNRHIYEEEIKVKAEHLDALNHVNNVTYLQWVQDMAEAHWHARTNEEINSKFYWVVLDHFIEYKKPAFEKDVLQAKTFVVGHNGVKSERHVEFYRGSDLLVRAQTHWCMLDSSNHRPRRIPNEVTNLFLIGND